MCILWIIIPAVAFALVDEFVVIPRCERKRQEKMWKKFNDSCKKK